MSVNDRLMKAFEEYGGLTLNERIYHFLGSLGFTNSLSDRLVKYTSGRYRGYRALIEDFGRSSQPWEDLFAEGQTLHFDFIKQRYGTRLPGHVTIVAGETPIGSGYISEAFAARQGAPDLATGSISAQPLPGTEIEGVLFGATSSASQLTIYFLGDVMSSLDGIRVWVGGVELAGTPDLVDYYPQADITMTAYNNPNMDPWVDGGQYNIGITLDGSEPSTTIDYTTNVNDLGILTRASTATYWGPEGSLLEAAVDEARIQHDPVTGEALGLLIEPSRTNNYARTTPPVWRECDPVEFIQHDRFIDAYKVTAPVDERSGDHRFTWNDSTLFPSDGTIFSFSITVKRLTDNIREVWLGQRGSSYFPGALDRSIFSFEDEMFTEETDNAEPGIVEDLGDGYFRITRIGSFGYGGIGIAFTDQNGNVDFSNDEVRELIIADIQVEAGTYPTSYIPTIDSPATRAEDYFELNMGDKASSTGGTFRVTAQVPEGELVMLISSQASGFLTLYSDSDEMKTYTLSHPEDVVSFSLGYGIHQSLEYFPEAQS